MWHPCWCTLLSMLCFSFSSSSFLMYISTPKPSYYAYSHSVFEANKSVYATFFSGAWVSPSYYYFLLLCWINWRDGVTSADLRRVCHFVYIFSLEPSISLVFALNRESCCSYNGFSYIFLLPSFLPINGSIRKAKQKQMANTWLTQQLNSRTNCIFEPQKERKNWVAA